MHVCALQARAKGTMSNASRWPSRGSRRSLGGGDAGRLGYNRLVESVDERALSSASTPVHNMNNGSGKSAYQVGRASVPSMYSEHEMSNRLPRRFSGAGYAAGMSPMTGKAAAGYVATRDAHLQKSGTNATYMSSEAYTATRDTNRQRTISGRSTPIRDENETPNYSESIYNTCCVGTSCWGRIQPGYNTGAFHVDIWFRSFARICSPHLSQCKPEALLWLR